MRSFWLFFWDFCLLELKANPNLQKIRPEDVIEDFLARKIIETGL